ncbi:hypothetical protein Vafri_11378 [Volvox africanus]|nr:hypothetical protein Vafri_11378 [Volvox africanus]
MRESQMNQNRAYLCRTMQGPNIDRELPRTHLRLMLRCPGAAHRPLRLRSLAPLDLLFQQRSGRVQLELPLSRCSRTIHQNAWDMARRQLGFGGTLLQSGNFW